MPRISAAGGVLIAAGVLLAAGPLAAQQPPHWRFFTSSDGLRESWVLDVTPGSNGRWWISHGNVDSLTVFDGYTTRQLPSPGATVAVREGPTGQLWALLPHPTALDVYIGLQSFENGRWIAHPLRGLPDAAGSMRRWHFLPWGNDRVLVACPDALIEFDRATGAQTTRLRAADTGLRAFTEFAPAADGGAWIGGRGAIGRLGPPGTGPLTLAENRAPAAWADAAIVQIHEAGHDAVFAAVQAGDLRGVLRIDTQAWRELVRPSPDTEDRIESWEGLPGELWTSRSAIRSFQLQVGNAAGPAVDVERTSALSGRLNAVRSAGQGAFWLATSLGLARHAPAAWRSPPELGKAVGHVAALFQSRQGELYALQERHLLRRAGDAWTVVPLPDNLRPDVSFTDNIAELPDGRILFGAYEGQGERIAFDGPSLPTFDPRTGQFATVRHPEGRRLQLVAAGAPGRIWVITGGGDDTRLETFDGRSFSPVFTAGRRWVSRPRSLVESANGEIVIVADGTGIGRWRQGKYEVLGREAGYPGTGPFCVLGLGDGRYWFGDRDSVIELASDRFRTVRSGLQGVRSLTRGRDGTIWVASGSGLHAYRDGSWLTITDADGLPAGSAYDVLETRGGDRGGEIWASTTSGISRYAPEADRDPPETFLDESANVRQAPPTGEARVIFGGRDRWHYTLPDRLLYAWRIDGQAWSPLQTEAVASLAHLEAGSHTFEVRAVDRNWNIDPTPARFEFAVLLPWYRAPGFLIVGTLGLLALGTAVGLLATRHLRLERLVTERTSALADSNQQLRRELDDRERMETERARLEAQLHQSQKLEALGRLAGGIAHDFNNLLTVVSSYSELMVADLPPDSPHATPAREISKAAERAAALTRQLLGFGRHQVMRPEVLELNDVVGDIGRMLKRLLGEDVDLQYRLGPGLWGVMADRGSIEQVIVNLAVNARDAMPHGGKLTVETSNVTLDAAFARVHVGVQPGAYVLLTVSDTGVGMNADTRTRIFEPFFTTKETGRGTGLGLATVYGIVTQANGHIWVYSEPGRGATFTIHLPRAESARDDRRAAAPSTTPRAVQGRETILLVEDDESVRTLTATILRSHGFVVLEAASGEDAEAAMARDGHRVDLVLSDIVLSGISGPTLIERLRRTWPDLGVVFMSGYADDAVVRHGLLGREMAFVQKPFVPDVLLRKLRETLDGSAMPTRRPSPPSNAPEDP